VPVTGKSVCFSDRLHGIIAGSNPPFFKSTVAHTFDGGYTCEVQYLLGSWLNDVVFTDDYTAWMVGDMDFIWCTEDCGRTWQTVPSGTLDDLNRIVFVEKDRIGFIFGEGNTLLKYEADTTGVYQKKRRTSVQQKLLHGYPNPFNGSVNIEYHLDSSSDVKINVYDVLGTHVRTLVDGNKETGTHQITWNGVNSTGEIVSSGFYLCRITTPKEKKTIRLLLIK
jgi:hypothetical protein